MPRAEAALQAGGPPAPADEEPLERPPAIGSGEMPAPGWRTPSPIGPDDSGHRAGVLLVDDHRENLVALHAVLEPLGERLVSADSGEQALRVLLREEIAVVLLDVRMAGLDGLATARIIRSRQRTRHIPIIFLTAQESDVGEIAAAYATGAVDYVIKPFEPEILRAKVAVFTELSRERAERVRQSRARAEAETVARTVRTLQILSDTALAHLEMDGLTSELLDRATTLFQARAGALLLRDESGQCLCLCASRGPLLPGLAEEQVTLGSGLLGRLASDREPALLQQAEVRLLAQAEGRAAATPASGIESMLVVPLAASGELVGLLVLGASAQQRFDPGDLELLTLAADRIALAIDHVQRFDQGRQLVETLQRNLLPERLAHNPRLKLAARYLPSGLAPQIGGDWYDSLELDDHRTAVMIGDVVGHGVRAAITMSELRNSLRALVLEGHSPGAALAQLNRVVQRTIGPGMIATVLLMVIDVAQESLTVAMAGHPPAAARGADGHVRLLESGGTVPLGVDEVVERVEVRYAISPGDTLLLFTDGLVERRREPIDVGLDRLRHALADAPADVEDVCDHVLRHTVGEQPSHDDVAMLAVALLPVPEGRLELTLPARPDSVPVARHRFEAWLKANAPHVDRATQADLKLAWTEACTNVVRHAYGPRDALFTASADRDGADVALSVSDTGQWRSPRGLHGGRGISLMRAVCDEVEIDRRPGGTTVRMRRRVDE